MVSTGLQTKMKPKSTKHQLIEIYRAIKEEQRRIDRGSRARVRLNGASESESRVSDRLTGTDPTRKKWN